jgi:hypothetical protein
MVLLLGSATTPYREGICFEYVSQQQGKLFH